MSRKNRFYIFLFVLALLPALSFAYTSDDLFKAALSYYQQKNYLEAIRYLKLVVQNDPTNWQAYQIMGNCYHDNHDDVSALAAYDNSLKANPKNPGLKSYTEELRSTNPSPVPAPETQARKIEHEYYDGIGLQEHARTELSQYGMDHPLTREEQNIVNYGTATCAREDRGFQLGLSLLGPTLIGIDMGLSLSPTTNLGFTAIYIPGSLFGYSDEYYYAVEPRIKFYSSPKDLSFFWGLGVDFADANDGNGNSNASWIAPNVKVGLSLTDSNGLYLEMDWSIGVVLISTTDSVYDYTTQNYSNSAQPGSFGAGLIPSTRIGLML